MTLFCLKTRSDSPAHEEPGWLQTIAPLLGRCSGCGEFRTDRAIDVPLEGKLDDSALNFFWRTGVSVAHVELLNALGRELVFENFRLGHVLDESGKPLPNVRTFQPVRSVFVRGSRSSKARRCDECRRILYAPVNMQHLVGDERELTGLLGANISATLIIDEGIRAKLAGTRFRKVSMFRINVLSEPIDGYPASLEELT